MHVITRKRLREFARRHPDAEGPLSRWYQTVSRSDFESFNELKKTFNSADKVGHFTVFNIGGNKYRLIVAIHYNRRKIYIRHVLTHEEYDHSIWED